MASPAATSGDVTPESLDAVRAGLRGHCLSLGTGTGDTAEAAARLRELVQRPGALEALRGLFASDSDAVVRSAAATLLSVSSETLFPSGDPAQLSALQEAVITSLSSDESQDVRSAVAALVAKLSLFCVESGIGFTGLFPFLLESARGTDPTRACSALQVVNHLAIEMLGKIDAPLMTILRSVELEHPQVGARALEAATSLINYTCESEALARPLLEKVLTWSTEALERGESPLFEAALDAIAVLVEVDDDSAACLNGDVMSRVIGLALNAHQRGFESGAAGIIAGMLRGFQCHQAQELGLVRRFAALHLHTQVINTCVEKIMTTSEAAGTGRTPDTVWVQILDALCICCPEPAAEHLLPAVWRMIEASDSVMRRTGIMCVSIGLEGLAEIVTSSDEVFSRIMAMSNDDDKFVRAAVLQFVRQMLVDMPPSVVPYDRVLSLVLAAAEDEEPLVQTPALYCVFNMFAVDDEAPDDLLEDNFGPLVAMLSDKISTAEGETRTVAMQALGVLARQAGDMMAGQAHLVAPALIAIVESSDVAEAGADSPVLGAMFSLGMLLGHLNAEAQVAGMRVFLPKAMEALALDGHCRLREAVFQCLGDLVQVPMHDSVLPDGVLDDMVHQAARAVSAAHKVEISHRQAQEEDDAAARVRRGMADAGAGAGAGAAAGSGAASTPGSGEAASATVSMAYDISREDSAGRGLDSIDRRGLEIKIKADVADMVYAALSFTQSVAETMPECLAAHGVELLTALCPLLDFFHEETRQAVTQATEFILSATLEAINEEVGDDEDAAAEAATDELRECITRVLQMVARCIQESEHWEACAFIVSAILGHGAISKELGFCEAMRPVLEIMVTIVAAITEQVGDTSPGEAAETLMPLLSVLGEVPLSFGRDMTEPFKTYEPSLFTLSRFDADTDIKASALGAIAEAAEGLGDAVPFIVERYGEAMLAGMDGGAMRLVHNCTFGVGRLFHGRMGSVAVPFAQRAVEKLANLVEQVHTGHPELQDNAMSSLILLLESHGQAFDMTRGMAAFIGYGLPLKLDHDEDRACFTTLLKLIERDSPLVEPHMDKILGFCAKALARRSGVDARTKVEINDFLTRAVTEDVGYYAAAEEGVRERVARALVVFATVGTGDGPLPAGSSELGELDSDMEAAIGGALSMEEREAAVMASLGLEVDAEGMPAVTGYGPPRDEDDDSDDGSAAGAGAGAGRGGLSDESDDDDSADEDGERPGDD